MSTFTPPKIYDVLDTQELSDAIAANHVREQFHPTEPLAILNYTERCVFENAWNDTLLQCRGLIYNTANGDVVARPFPKFFNHGQAGAPTIPLSARVVVTDKVDGSLGILYRRPSDGKLAIATRGSFTSDQALHATEVLHTKHSHFELDEEDTTLLFEIVYPENRIVLDYNGQDDLVLLGGVDKTRGAILKPRHAAPYWGGPITTVFPTMTFAEALAMPPRPNAEGLVVRRWNSNDMVKLKQADYVELHRLVTNLTTRTIWQALAAGQTIEEIVAPLPDEFHAWAHEVALDLTMQVVRRKQQLQAQYRFIQTWVDGVQSFAVSPDPRAAKKEFAAQVSHHVSFANRWAMFALYDHKDITPKLWKQVEPPPGQTPSNAPKEDHDA